MIENLKHLTSGTRRWQSALLKFHVRRMVSQILKTGDFRHTKMANAVEYDDFEERAILRIQGLNLPLRQHQGKWPLPKVNTPSECHLNNLKP